MYKVYEHKINLIKITLKVYFISFQNLYCDYKFVLVKILNLRYLKIFFIFFFFKLIEILFYNYLS